eukprot:TRINITY_DN6806_c0_g1_i2.p1 TRINITY_DN6806_c0_g1~~TRINITY_DN6806_c0_g1_i2.p1  ORF type:complete len:459 (+),score=86.38 TRINITY_DN6806_c0_g1_i2:121-1497(+)
MQIPGGRKDKTGRNYYGNEMGKEEEGGEGDQLEKRKGNIWRKIPTWGIIIGAKEESRYKSPGTRLCEYNNSFAQDRTPLRPTNNAMKAFGRYTRPNKKYKKPLNSNRSIEKIQKGERTQRLTEGDGKTEQENRRWRTGAAQNTCNISGLTQTGEGGANTTIRTDENPKGKEGPEPNQEDNTYSRPETQVAPRNNMRRKDSNSRKTRFEACTTPGRTDYTGTRLETWTTERRKEARDFTFIDTTTDAWANWNITPNREPDTERRLGTHVFNPIHTMRPSNANIKKGKSKEGTVTNLANNTTPPGNNKTQTVKEGNDCKDSGHMATNYTRTESTGDSGTIGGADRDSTGKIIASHHKNTGPHTSQKAHIPGGKDDDTNITTITHMEVDAGTDIPRGHTMVQTNKIGRGTMARKMNGGEPDRPRPNTLRKIQASTTLSDAGRPPDKLTPSRDNKLMVDENK